MMETNKKIPNLSKQAFWDIDMKTLDYEVHANYIIEAVFQFGTFDDLLQVVKFYGIEKCKKALISARFLRYNAMAIASLLFDIPKNDFVCLTNRRSRIPF